MKNIVMFVLLLICYEVFPAVKAKFDISPVITDTSCILTNKSSSFTSLKIDFGDGIIITDDSTQDTYSHHYKAYGDYTICVIAYNLTKKKTESDTLCKMLTLKPCSASFDFLADKLNVSFTNTSTDDFKKLMWDFGDGKTSGNKNLKSHTYKKPGAYNVSLTIINQSTGCYNKLTQKVIVIVDSTQCVSNFDYTFSNDSITVNFVNHSLGQNLGYFWHFGNGKTSKEENPVFTYKHPGIYNVELIIKNKQTDCKSSYEKLLVVEEKDISIKADFDYIIDTDTNQVIFKNTSIGENIKNYFWNFGDGTTAKTSDTVHVYTKAGNYQVCLSVSQSGGKTYNSECRKINIGKNFPPEPYFSFLADGLTVNFANLTDSLSDSIIWTFGDRQTSFDNEPTHTYSDKFIYTAAISVKYGSIWFQTIKILNLTDKPENLTGRFIYIVDDTKLKATGKKVKFRGAISGDISRLRFVWDFGDGTADSTTLEPVHAYSSDGTYIACLTVFNDLTGNEDVSCDTVVVGVPLSIKPLYSEINFEHSIFPNPANTSVTLKYSLSKASHISIDIIDLSGRRVMQVLNEYQPVGIHSMTTSVALDKGLYFIRYSILNRKFCDKLRIE